jgi:hypothetical protein
VQSSTKGVYRKRGGSNAVGFRCVQDVGTRKAPATALTPADTIGLEGTTA